MGNRNLYQSGGAKTADLCTMHRAFMYSARFFFFEKILRSMNKNILQNLPKNDHYTPYFTLDIKGRIIFEVAVCGFTLKTTWLKIQTRPQAKF